MKHTILILSVRISVFVNFVITYVYPCGKKEDIYELNTLRSKIVIKYLTA